jgi:heme/copper-type cytochrome/quinol oxidase subunit 2
MQADAHIRVIITAADALHSWIVPSLGINVMQHLVD